VRTVLLLKLAYSVADAVWPKPYTFVDHVTVLHALIIICHFLWFISVPCSVQCSCVLAFTVDKMDPLSMKLPRITIP